MAIDIEQVPSYTWLLDTLYDGAYCVDSTRTITYWNPACERLTGYTAAEVVGQRCAANILRHVNERGENLCEGVCPLAGTLHDGERREGIFYLHHKDGHRVPVQARCAPLRDANGDVIGALELFRDASLLEMLQQRIAQLEELAFLDGLTGLANRRFLEETLAQRLDEWQRYGWPFGIILADIDHFKQVNDSFGHDMGDRVLRMVAQTFAHGCRSFDLIGRWGGEEFLGIFPHVDTLVLGTLAERLRMLVESAFLVADPHSHPLAVTISVGATVILPNDTVDTVLHRVDKYLYRSKQEGRNRVTTDIG